ncbi:MAG: SWIB/MDM2 domain-containing protein [Pseudomonadota bacterium]
MANALQTPVKLSAELEAVVGAGPMPRTEVTSKVWAYIKANGLQKESDKRTIVPDAKLGAVIGNDEINMMKMTGQISKHLTKA